MPGALQREGTTNQEEEKDGGQIRGPSFQGTLPIGKGA